MSARELGPDQPRKAGRTPALRRAGALAAAARFPKRVLELLAGSASLEEVLEAIVRIIEEQSSGAAGAICLVDPETNQVRLGAAPNVPDDFWRIAQTISIAPTSARSPPRLRWASR